MNTKGLFVIIFGTLIMTSACKKDFFDLKRPPEQPWLNISQFDNAAVGAYQAMFTGDAWNIVVGANRLLKTTESDVVQLLQGTSGNIPFNEMYNRLSDVPNQKTDGIFNTCYQSIATCNRGLDFVEQAGGNPFSNLNQSDLTNNLNRIQGELHFLRGYAYWTLAGVFLPPYDPQSANADKVLPLRIHFVASFDGAKSPKIGTTEEIYTQIVNDFKMAKELLPEKYMSGMNSAYQYGRVNRFAASAMLAKVYFMMGNDKEALTELDDVIDQNGGMYDLSEDPIEAFNNTAGKGGKESIWYIPYALMNNFNAYELTSMDVQLFFNKNGGNSWPDGGFVRVSWGQYAMSYTMLKQIGWMTDPLNGDYTITDEAKKDKRFQELYRVLKGYNPSDTANPAVYETVHSQVTTPMVWCDKYYRGNGTQTNIPMIRLAEMYLTRSILRLRSGDIPGATSDLNTVRNRAGLNDLSHPITEQDINNERIKELTFEGDRIDYLRSAKLSIPPGDRSISPVPYNDKSLVWPVPQSESDLNDGYVK